MKIGIIGSGPSGLYLSIFLKIKQIVDHVLVVCMLMKIKQVAYHALQVII